MLAIVWEILPCQSASETPKNSPGYVSQIPEPNKSSYSAWVTVSLPKKTECECQSADALTDEDFAACWRLWTLMERQVLGAAAEQFLEGVLWPWKWFKGDSYCISVTFSSQTQEHPVLWVAWWNPNSQSYSGSKLKSKRKSETDPRCSYYYYFLLKKKDEICQTLEKILNKQKRHVKSIITDWKTLWKTPSTAAAFLIMQ